MTFTPQQRAAFTGSTSYTIPDLILMIERDMPGCDWIVGNCEGEPVCSEGKPYVAGIRRITPFGWALDMLTGQTEPIGREHWKVSAHGETPLEALGNAYGLAMEKQDEQG